MEGSVKAMQDFSLVWVYKREGAEEDTLQTSFNLAKKNITGCDVDDFFVCGDIPENWQGRVIKSEVVTQAEYKKKTGKRFRNRWRKWVDSIWKIQRIIDCDRVKENFLWMYDDTFICKEFNPPEEIGNPWFRGFYSGVAKHSNYQEVMRRTFEALENKGFPKLNFSSHAPMLYNKTKLRSVINKFGCLTKPRLVESIYGNAVESNPKRITAEMFRYLSSSRKWPGDSTSGLPKILNVGNGSYLRHRENLIGLLDRNHST